MQADSLTKAKQIRQGALNDAEVKQIIAFAQAKATLATAESVGSSKGLQEQP